MESAHARSGSSPTTALFSRARDILVPSHVLMGDTEFRWDDSVASAHEAQPGRKVLNELVHLTSGRAREEIRRFVTTRGLLLPGTVSTRPRNWRQIPEHAPKRSGGPGSMEMSHWEELARSAHATLATIGALQRDDLSLINWDWLAVGPTDYVKTGARTPTDASAALLESIRQWQECSEMSVQVCEPPTRSLLLEGRGLAAVVAFELLTAYLNPMLVGFCSVCDTPYVGVRKPPAGGRENFCDRHRVTGKSRLAKQRERSSRSDDMGAGEQPARVELSKSEPPPGDR